MGAAALAGLIMSLACSSEVEQTAACADEGQVLDVGFYAFFAPMSYSGSESPGAPGFDSHLGYEADLLTALERMDGAGLAFSRKPIEQWDDIWLKSATPEYDIVGGGITILDSRTRNADGEEVVAFTSGHVTFRQSLLVRAEDEQRLSSHDKLTSGVRVGALANSTGEARLLEITGIVNADGALAAGTRVETPDGEVTADGSDSYVITSAKETPNLAKRQRLHPPSDTMPQVIYLGDELGEIELLEALQDGRIDALARGEIGNRDASHATNSQFVVTALDDAVERGGFTLSVDDADLLSCLNEKIDYLTDNRNIGYAEWRADSSVFIRRAEEWTGG